MLIAPSSREGALGLRAAMDTMQAVLLSPDTAGLLLLHTDTACGPVHASTHPSHECPVLCMLSTCRRADDSPAAAATDTQHGVLILTLALVHDRRLAGDLYPVCKALAGSVAAGCSLVTCSSVDDVAALLASPRWVSGASKTITALRITNQRSAPLAQGPAAFGGPSLCVRITALKRPLSVASLRSLFRLASSCQDLQLLDISGARMLDQAAKSKLLGEVAAAAPFWPQLKHLELRWSVLDTKGMRSLAAAAHSWPRLQHLDLSVNSLRFDGTDALVTAAQWWPRLRLLDLSTNNLGPPAAQALLKAACHWSQLQHLNVGSNSLGLQGTQALAAAGCNWSQLQRLDLYHCHIEVHGAAALAAAAVHWPHLTHLNLSNNSIGPEGAAALARAAQHWPDLQHLDLYCNNIRAQGAQALAGAGQHWTRLQHLGLMGNNLGREAEAALCLAVPCWQGSIHF